MTMQHIRVGLIGAGANMKSRHIPGLRRIEGVEITSVCNRRAESTAAVAKEFSIPKSCNHWEEVIADKDIDAVVIGTWPYLHCAITIASLEAGKHVLTEARMSMNAKEAHQMFDASKKSAHLVTQIVPSPFGFKGDKYMKQLIAEGYLGDLREVHVFSRSGHLADEATPLSWRQDAHLSGYNMLTLGIVHETLMRWAPPPVRVFAQVEAFVSSRIDPESGVRTQVGTPDSLQILTVLKNGARATYHFSAVAPFGEGHGIHLYGTKGALLYDLGKDSIRGASQSEGSKSSCDLVDLRELAIPSELEYGWRVEEEFIEAIRDGKPIGFTNFESGVAYMEFTEAVARSAELGQPIDLPLAEFNDSNA